MSCQAKTWSLPALASRVILIVGMMSTMSDGSMALAQEADVEAAVCGSVREPLMFWLWRSTAGSPNSTRVAHIRNLEQVRFQTRDGVELGGYKLAAKSA